MSKTPASFKVSLHTVPREGHLPAQMRLAVSAPGWGKQINFYVNDDLTVTPELFILALRRLATQIETEK